MSSGPDARFISLKFVFPQSAHQSFSCLFASAGEGFRTTGLMVTERNWLEVYPWSQWGGNSNLPNFQEGAVFEPTELLLKTVRMEAGKTGGMCEMGPRGPCCNVRQPQCLIQC